MTELGQRLKSARNDKDLSLDEIQSITKIQKRYLLAIEEGNYELLPGNFYTRAFIKNYAEAVGLHGEELLEEYASEIPKTNSDVPENLPPRRTRPTLTSKPNRWSSVFPSVLVILLIIGVACIIWFVVQGNDATTSKDGASNQTEEQVSSDENSGNAPASDEVSDEPKDDSSKEENKEEPAPADTEEEEPEETKEPEEETAPKMELKKTEGNASKSTYEITNAEKFEITVEAKGSSWVALTGKSNKKYIYESLTKGKKVTHDLTKEASASIRIGSSPNITVLVNGEKIDIPNEPVVQNVTFNYKKAE
ncbi:helix-turn-helix domain-containing protein [Guptibacillus algicola]|uniref:helix-turn-helix domain-containing protein n=1 Tax=Guptibacillus algicola TaxID=225844 RepID=UPI001CD57957|nr:helix-turn-helix domain-containing protein [Alkalihalobacillus algicola]MCA0988109.1 helix-turn-helix domain-containing protein [Alkalihalobacillus algicola]